MLVFLFSLCFLAHAGLLAAALYSLVVIADLESDFVNPHDCAASLNKWLVRNEFFLFFFSSMVMGESIVFFFFFFFFCRRLDLLFRLFSHTTSLSPPLTHHHNLSTGPRVRHPVGHSSSLLTRQGLGPGPRTRSSFFQALARLPQRRRDG